MTDNQSIPSHLQIALASIRCFASDGTLNVDELNELLAIAEADGGIDDEEARVLSNIMNKALESPVDGETVSRIQQISERIMRRHDDS